MSEIFNHNVVEVYLRTWVGEVERKTETAFHDEWEDTSGEVECNDALSVWTKGLVEGERNLTLVCIKHNGYKHTPHPP